MHDAESAIQAPTAVPLLRVEYSADGEPTDGWHWYMKRWDATEQRWTIIRHDGPFDSRMTALRAGMAAQESECPPW